MQPEKNRHQTYVPRYKIENTKRKKNNSFLEKIVRSLTKFLNWLVHGFLYLQKELKEEQGTHQMLLDAIDKAWTRKLVK